MNSTVAEETLEDRCCSAEELFEFCEGSLPPDHERAVRSHLRRCEGCHSRYERESSLSLALCSSAGRVRRDVADVSRVTSAGTARSVAMALPTRSAVARLVWGGGAAALLAAALVSLAVYAVRPVSFATDFMAACWGLTSGVADVAGILLAVSGSTILVALLVGAFVDALIAATLLAVARWWRPRGA